MVRLPLKNSKPCNTEWNMALHTVFQQRYKCRFEPSDLALKSTKENAVPSLDQPVYKYLQCA